MAALTATPGLAPGRTTTPRPPSKLSTPSGPDPGHLPAAGRRANRPASTDPLSDRATAALIRRSLCPQQLADKGRDAPAPIEDLLPPLTSRNDVDLQLYAFLAIIMKEFVQSWYGKITTDETFVAEIMHTVAHCTRDLEQRLRKLDLESLLLDDIPDLLDKHVTAYRTAHQAIPRPPVQVDPHEVYHSLFPLPLLSPVPRPDDPATVSEQAENEAAYRQLLVQAVLATLLPTEDLENPCLTALVGQIFSELIIGNVIANKAAQPWLLYEGICILARDLQVKKTRAAQRIVSGTHAPELELKLPADKRGRWSARGFFLAIIHLGILALASVRFLVGTLVMSSSLPPRPTIGDDEAGVAANEKATRQHGAGSPAKVPVLAFSIWSCVGNLADMGSKMPWVSGILSLIQHGAIHGPGQLAGLNSALDRLLSHHIRSVFAPAHLPPILRSLRGALFPNNAPGRPSLFPPSSDVELRALRRRAALALWGLLPKGLGRVYFGGRLWRRGSGGTGTGAGAGTSMGEDAAAEEQRMLDELESLLDVFGDVYCNKHLMYGVLELILVRLVPELNYKGVVELWEERLG